MNMNTIINNYFFRHCEYEGRSNLRLAKGDCFVAIAPRNDDVMKEGAL